MHDKDLLATRTEKPDILPSTIASVPSAGTTATSLLSNVCCQDVDESPETCIISTPSQQPTRTVSAFSPPPPPENGLTFSLGILTVSDRAAANQYETGDLSGPAVEDSVNSTLEKASTDGGTVSCTIVHKAVVADDVQEIQTTLKDWSDNSCHLILTTGGTGFGKRDVTPEATVGILDRECRGLLSFVTTECSQQQQPLASLSRGTAGIRGNTFICNLPGNPKGVREIVPILLPILLHAISDMKQE
jgi:gephyrin